MYLGILIEANPRKQATWEPILAKLRSKLLVWKHKFLSLGGKVCLVNLVLSFLFF